MSEYTVNGTRVQGKGYSYHLPTKIEAQKLCTTLNQYEQHTQATTTLQEAQKQLIHTIMTLNILQHDLEKLKETLK